MGARHPIDKRHPFEHRRRDAPSRRRRHRPRGVRREHADEPWGWRAGRRSHSPIRRCDERRHQHGRRLRTGCRVPFRRIPVGRRVRLPPRRRTLPGPMRRRTRFADVHGMLRLGRQLHHRRDQRGLRDRRRGVPRVRCLGVVHRWHLHPSSTRVRSVQLRRVLPGRLLVCRRLAERGVRRGRTGLRAVSRLQPVRRWRWQLRTGHLQRLLDRPELLRQRPESGQCGIHGEPCHACTGGQQCAPASTAGGVCQDAGACGPQNCPGCCDGTTCLYGDQYLECGAGGSVCASCAGYGLACEAGVCR